MIYYSVENTGWSGGISWFESGGSLMNPLRFSTEQEAVKYIAKQSKELNDSSVLWRSVKHEFIRNMQGDKCTSDSHTREYTYHE